MAAAERSANFFRRGRGKWLLVLLASTLAGAWVRAGEFETANELFEQGKFGDAKQHFEKLVESGEAGANVFYNLGNTDYRLGATGRAILNYERALALNPRHPEAEANLKMLRDQAGSKVRARSAAQKAFGSQTLKTWTWALAASSWALLFGFALLAIKRRAGSGGLWLLTLSGAAVAALAAIGFWWALAEQQVGIIVAQQTDARLAPTDSAGVAEALPAGSRVRLLSARGQWIYCELPGAGRGWIAASAVERVRPEPS